MKKKIITTIKKSKKNVNHPINFTQTTYCTIVRSCGYIGTKEKAL